MPEHGNGAVGTNEAVPAQRGQFTDRYAVAGHHERLAFIESSHDLSALGSQLSLSDLSGHAVTV
jgi:hypothetical protein